MAICVQWVAFVLCVCVSFGVCMLALVFAVKSERTNEHFHATANICAIRMHVPWHTNNTSTRLCFLMKRRIRVVCKCNTVLFTSTLFAEHFDFNNELNNRQLIDTMSSVFLPCILDICLEMRKKKPSNLIYTNNIGRKINLHRNKLLHRRLFCECSERKKIKTKSTKQLKYYCVSFTCKRK